VEWPLVRTHAGSGRKLLFVGIHCTHIVGMTLAEGRVLLADLLEHATQREFIYRHVWWPGDLVMWDNRCTVHRGRRFDLSARRELRRVTSEEVEATA
jgi:alpha-ketoglutarate-dependent 2,4-dichlorophenoxyacetate dioxygenase